jgi:DNA-binding transcriptional ArsR family regulator
MTDLFSVLCAPRRREILRQIWQQEQPAGAIYQANSDITFGAVSQHLKILQEAGLVDCRHDGQHRLYLARKEQLGSLQEWLESMWDSALYRLKVRAEIEQAKRGPQAKKRASRGKTRKQRRKP